MAERHRVVVVGAGFGGLAVARALAEEPVDVVLVDANNFHTFQPLLYQVATAGLDADDVAHSVRGIFQGQRNITVRMAKVTAVDLDARTVTTDRGEPLHYDDLVLAAGAISADFGVPGVAEHGLPLKALEDAVTLREHVLDRFEAAAVEPALVEVGALSVVVCGGGPTGVEMAGGLMELFERVLSRDFPALDVRRARVVLVEAGDRLLPPFHPKLSERARRTLARRGVEVLLGVGVARVAADGVELADGRWLPAQTTVWAAGVRANPLAEALPVERGRGGRIIVGDDLTIPGRPETFVIGDLALVDGGDGPLPQVAQPAIQGGHHVARQIGRRLAGRPLEPFRYVEKGSMATIGRHDAVADLGHGIRLGGPIGWAAWLGLHLVYLIGFRNRANVLVNWAWNYVTYDRGSRILAASQRPPAARPNAPSFGPSVSPSVSPESPATAASSPRSPG